jgi:hypothetical protein
MLKSEPVELNAKANLPFRIKNSYQFYKNKEILENSILRLKEIQCYFVANCVPICQNNGIRTSTQNYPGNLSGL